MPYKDPARNRECARISVAKWRKNNPELAKVRRRESYRRCYKKSKDMPYKDREKRKECARKWAAAWRARNPERAAFHRRQSYLKTRDARLLVERTRRIKQYGMTMAEYDQKKSLYPICPICERRKVNVLDHNHETGQIRDFLCTQCNLNLHAIENKEYFEKALKYLSRFKEKEHVGSV